MLPLSLNPLSMHWSVSLLYLYIINGVSLRIAYAVHCSAASEAVTVPEHVGGLPAKTGPTALTTGPSDDFTIHNIE